MISLSNCRRKTHLLFKYCNQISKDNLSHLEFRNMKYRPFFCLCSPTSRNFIGQIKSNYIGLGFLSCSTIFMRQQTEYEKTYDLNNQLFQFIKASDVDQAFKCLQKMHSSHVPIRCHYFWPLFIQMHKKSGESGVLDVLDRMLALDVTCDYETYAYYLCPHLNLKKPLLTIRILQDRNLKVQQILTPLCVVLLQQNQIKEVMTLCFEIFPETKLTHEDFIAALVEYYINTSNGENTIKFLKREKNIENAGDIFLTKISQSKNPLLEVEKVQMIITDLIKAEVMFSPSAVYDLRTYFSKHGLITSNFEFYEKTTRKKPPRLDVDRPVPSLGEMSTSELEHRLTSMRSRLLDPKSVLKRLFFKYCQEKKYAKAFEVKEELELSQVKFTLGMQSSCIDLHIYYQEAEKAESVLSRLRQIAPNFQIDDYKIVDLACVYVQQEQYQKALELVSTIRPRANLNQKVLERNCKELLNNIQNEQVLLAMFEILCQKKLCSVTSTPILSTIIRYFLNRNNMDKALSYFQKFSLTLRRTPLKHELLLACIQKNTENLIISKEKPESLHVILDAITRIHGKASCSVTYITALAEASLADTLRRYVQDELELTPEFLTKMADQIHRLSDQNKINSLLLLQDLFETSDQLVDDIYLALLQIHCRKDNDEEIKKLTMRYEKIKLPSEDYLSLVNSRLKM